MRDQAQSRCQSGYACCLSPPGKTDRDLAQRRAIDRIVDADAFHQSIASLRTHRIEQPPQRRPGAVDQLLHPRADRRVPGGKSIKLLAEQQTWAVLLRSIPR